MSRPSFRAALAALAWACTALAPLQAAPARPAPSAAQASVAAATAPPSAAARWSRLRDTSFQHWTPDQGLPHPIVTALAQDGAGFLWVGTQDGLARFDGYRFRTRKAGLPNPYVDALHADAAGRLWVGSDDGSISRLDPSTDTFVQAVPDTGQAAPARVAEVTSLADDGTGGQWVGTSDGLRHVEAPATGAPRWRTAPAGPPTGPVTALLHDLHGALWIGLQAGLWRCDGRLVRPRCDIVELSDDPLAASPPVAALAQGADGRVWVGTHGLGVLVVGPDGSSPRAAHDDGRGPDRVSLAEVSTLVQAPGGEVWVGTNGDGAWIVDSTTLAARHLRHDQRRPAGLASDATFAMVVDRSGLLWLGGRRGLSRTAPAQDAIVTLPGQGADDGLTDLDAPTLLAAADGTLWVGGADNGIDILDPAGVRVRHLDLGTVPGTGTAPKPGVAAKNPVSSLQQAADGSVYIGARDGLFRAGPKGDGLRRLPWATSRRASVQEMTLAGSTLWIGSRAEGLWKLDLSAGPNAAPVRPAGADQIGDARIVALRRDDTGLLWIGTPTGLAILDPSTGRVEHARSAAADPQSLSHDFVSSVLVDRDHRVWIGTLGGGIDLVTGRDASGRLRFRRFGVADGLPTPNVGTMLQGVDGRIWASSDGGFAVIDPATLSIGRVGRADGATITSYWIGSGVVTDHQELVFGGAGGATVVRPERFRPWAFQPPVVVTETRVQGGAAQSHVDLARGLVLAPGERAFGVEFAALDLSAPERIRYAYRLDGAEDAWTDTDAEHRLAAYTNLGPGRYTLELRGSNRDGAWSPAVLRLPVDVRPLWWQTWWARGAQALAVVLVVAVIVRLRTRALERREQDLQRQVAARTAELEQKQEELLRANETLAQLANFDPLTRCLNRRAFLEQGTPRLEEAAARGAPTWCVMVDIDHFKAFNDRFGHPLGDAVIRGVAAVLQRALRGTDLICRFGGEEFCVLLPGVEEAAARMLAERIRSRIQEEAGPGVREIEGLCVTASVGLASTGAETTTLEALIGRADEALYAAKRGGRNRVAVGPEGEIASAAERPPQWEGAEA